MDRYKYYLTLCLESSWLIVALFIPLLLISESNFIAQDVYSRFEVPKTVFLKVSSAVVLVLWILKELPLKSRISSPFVASRILLKDIGSNTSRIILLSVIILGLSTFISTLGSSSAETSMWGHQPGNDPFSLYSILCYGILFGALARNLKTDSQASRLLSVFASSGAIVAVYGIFEYLGIDLLNTNETGDFSRISSTLGNSLIAGSFLVISIGIALTALFHKLHSIHKNSSFDNSVIVLLSTSIILQLGALFFTGSRGPLVALVFLMILFGSGSFVFNKFTSAIRNTIILLSILIITAALITLCTLIKTTPVAPFDSPVGGAQVQHSEPSSFTRVASIPAVISEGGLNGRIYTWANTTKASLERSPLEQGRDYGKATRFIIGYGPELMEFAFLKTALPYGSLNIPATPDQAHNIFLHYLIEQGLIGLLASIFFFGSPLLILWMALKDTDKQNRSALWLIVGGSITMLAYALEQQVGITKVTGFTLYFMLLGIVYASIKTQSAGPDSNGKDTQEAYSNTPTQLAIQVLTSSLLIMLICAITLSQNINQLRAGLIAAEGVQAYEQGNLVKGHWAFTRAIDLSPRLPIYFHYQNAVLKQIADQVTSAPVILPPRCGIFTDAVKITECIYGEIYMNAKQAYLNNGYNWNTTFEAAQGAFDIKQDEEAISLFNTMINQAPNSYPLKNHVGYIHYLLADYHNAQIMFDQSLNLTGTQNPTGRTALMYTGLIQAAQGEHDRAYETLMVSLELFLEARNLQYGYASDLQENKDILSISLELNNLAEVLGKDPPVKIE